MRCKELLFIQNKETIDLVKEQKSSNEWDFFSKYIKDKRLKLLVQMGIALRRLEEKEKRDQIQNLREKILSKYGTKGLHIAQFVQNRLLKEQLTGIVDKANSVPELIEKTDDFLNNLENRVTFVQSNDSTDILKKQISTRLLTIAPFSYIIFARDSALNLGKEIEEWLKNQINNNYDVETRSTKNSIIIILTKTRDPLDSL